MYRNKITYKLKRENRTKVLFKHIIPFWDYNAVYNINTDDLISQAFFKFFLFYLNILYI